MNSILYGCLACLAATPFVLARGAEGGTVPLDVEFKLTDREYRPLAGVPLRLVLGIEDWQAADAGVRIVTGEDGAARFTTQAVIDRSQWLGSFVQEADIMQCSTVMMDNGEAPD
jgi:hypothetical protein